MSREKLTALQDKILRKLYIESGSPCTARSISLALDVSSPAILKALPLLEKKGFVSVSKDRKSSRLAIELNRENQDIIGLKRADNLKQIYESGLAGFFRQGFLGATIILFGSYSSGEDNFSSDIDIAIIGAKPKDVNLGKYEKKLSRRIIINFYESFNEIDKPLLGNILGGIVLGGGIEL